MPMVPAKNSSRGSFQATGLACVVIVLAALAVYSNSFSGPFTLDDVWSITTNPTIHRFGSALSPPPGKGVGGRPVLNLTFALNYALGGMKVWGYHALNLLIHALAGLTLFGLVRRTLECGRGALTPHLSRSRGEGTPPTVLALAIAVIWVVHPLQTEAVTYISQRAESLMGLFYLLTMYCFVRGTDETGQRQKARGERAENETRDPQVIRPLGSGLPVLRLVRRSFSEGGSLGEGGWPLASICCCLLGVLTKEVIVTAPVMVFFYDRTFVAGSFRAAWRLRWRYYLGLAGTWLPLACLMTGLHQRGVGFDQGVTWWHYALTSCRSVVLYLKLAVWPHPLVFDYGTEIVQHATEIVPYALILAGLLVATAFAWWRRPAMGFAGAWFFVILAPTSSVIPVFAQPMAEHRMYLSLAAVVTVGVLGLHGLMGRRSLVVLVAAAMGLGWLGFQRNKDYASELALWSDTVAKRPDSARARNNLGCAWADIPGRRSEAISEYEEALRINPDYPDALYNLGKALADIPGRQAEAISAYEAAVRSKPDYVEAHYNLGILLANTPGRLPEAISHFETALRIEPDNAVTHYNLGIALAATGHTSEAISQFEAAVRLKPGYAEAHYNLGTSLGQSGRISEAISELEEAVRLNPNYAEAHNNLGLALYQAGRIPEAIDQFKEVLRIVPDSPDARAYIEKLQKAAK